MTLPALEDLRIYGHEFDTDGDRGWGRLSTSQGVGPATARRFISVDPERTYDIVADNTTLTLRGDFAPGSSVTLVVRKGMESVLGGRTQGDYEAEILIGNVAPSFRYASPAGTYMLRSGGRTVEVRTVNLDRIIVRVSQVFANNLVHFLYGGRQYDWGSWSYSEEEGETFDEPRAKWRYVLGHYGRVLRTDTVALSSPANREVSTWIDLGTFMSDAVRGFYLLEIADPREPWRTASKLVSVSDIGLILKRSPGEAAVFAVSLDANTPMLGTRIALVSSTNQTMAAATTDAQGMARFADYGTLSRDASLMLVTAEADEDFNFLNLSDYRVEPTVDLFATTGEFDEEATETVRNRTAGTQTRGPADSDGTEDVVGLQVAVPIFTSGVTSSRVREQVYLHRASRQRLQGTLRVAERSTRDAYLTVLADKARVDALRQAVTSSETTVRATIRGVEVGERTNVDVLNARRALFDAERDYARARYDYLTNLVRLRATVGVLLPADLAAINGYLVEPISVAPTGAPRR